MGLIYLGPVSTMDVKFDFVSIFKQNGLNQMADEFHQQLDELGADLRQFFNDLAADPIDDLDYAIGQDVGKVVTVLYDDVVLLEHSLRKAVSDKFAVNLTTVAKLLEKLNSNIKQVFEPRISGHNRPNQSIYRKNNTMGSMFQQLSVSLGNELTSELRPNFGRMLCELYRELGLAFDEALDEQLNRLSPPGAGGRAQLPEKYQYLIPIIVFGLNFGQIIDSLFVT
ncbi:uncharacterized protein LOC128951535 [Oppia nitens]|uniref:uncharacterized protein LOC128951535 n=1 Tax=Oppia nitens TaxID=1686743 RepID=UPI0023DC0665|nr:uncharacterized protein LOC128951535 [Oppia nitens]